MALGSAIRRDVSFPWPLKEEASVAPVFEMEKGRQRKEAWEDSPDPSFLRSLPGNTTLQQNGGRSECLRSSPRGPEGPQPGCAGTVLEGQQGRPILMLVVLCI